MSTTHAQTFGALLKRHRLACGLTQAELAERAGLSTEAVSALERGVNRAPRKDTVTLLADALRLEGQDRALLERASRQPKAAFARPDAEGDLSPIRGSTLPLFGRDGEMALVQQVLDGGAPPSLFLTGEPGIGKTRLLREAGQQASMQGWAVLAGECQRQGGQTPFAPLLSTLERYILQQAPQQQRTDLQGCSWLVRLLPELLEMGIVDAPGWTLPPDQERRLMFTAVGRFLSNVSGPSGTLLILDNLQWIDGDGCDLLATLLRSGGRGRLRVIGAYRDTEADMYSPLAALLADLTPAGLTSIAVMSPLDLTNSARLLRGLLDEEQSGGETADQEQTGEAWAEQVVRQAGGIPFYLVSWAQALRAGALEAEAEHPVPWDIVQSVRQRIGAIDEVGREILRVAAVSGAVAPRSTLVSIAGRSAWSEDDVIGGLEATCQAKLLAEGTDDAYQFAHQLIRDVVMRDLSLARRTALHRRLAETLEREHGDGAAEALAYHFAHGGEPARASLYLERAGDRAAAMQAYAAAEAHYRELIQVYEGLGRRQDAARAQEKLGKVLGAHSQYAEALVLLAQAAESYRSVGDVIQWGLVETEIGQTHADQGSAPEGLARLQAVLAADNPGISMSDLLPTRILAGLYDVQAQLLHVAGEYSRQLEVAEQAEALARTAGDEQLLGQIQMRRGNALRMLGRMEEASQVLEDVIERANTTGDERTLAYALDNASGVYLLQGEFARTVRYVDRALELMEQIGDPLMIALLLLRRGMNEYALGDWKQAFANFDRAHQATAQLGVSWVSAYTSLGLGQFYLATGEPERGVALLEESVALARRSGDLQALRWAETSLAEYDLLEGRPGAARDRLEPLLDRPGLQEGLVTYLLPYLAWACLELDDGEQAEVYLSECLQRAAGENIRLAWVDALRVKALQALNATQTMREVPEVASQAGEEALDQAADLCRQMSFPYAEAKLWYTRGLLAARGGRPEAARQSLRASQTILARLGESLYRQRVERLQGGVS